MPDAEQKERSEAAVSARPLPLRLHEHPLRREFMQHEFFDAARRAAPTRQQVALVLGQWWHPLHFFPTFLGQCVATLPDIESKCAIAKILHQEVGQGDPRRAHEVVFVDTMERIGFSRAQLTQAEPFVETAELVDAFRAAAGERYAALGFLFATEVIDLIMVSSIGVAVRQVTQARELDWVDIHVQQEPDHVEEANHAMLSSFGPDEQDLIQASAERSWRLWTSFFDRLAAEVSGGEIRRGERATDVTPRARP